MTGPTNPLASHKGFTLTELAVVVAIIALLIGGMLMSFVAQEDLRKTSETERTLNEARNALIGFAAAQGRLPCPAIDGSNGAEAPAGGGVCTLFHASDTVPVGYLPAATLGIGPIDKWGRLLDAWGNPIRYAVTTAKMSAFTKPNGMSSIGIAALDPDLIVCPTATSGGTNMTDCPSGISALTKQAVAVVYSLGANIARGGKGIDERHNPNVIPPSESTYVAADPVFISHEPAPIDAPNGEFDDIVVWLSPNILFNRMIAAGRLP